MAEGNDSGMIKRIVQTAGLFATIAFMVIACMLPFSNGGDNNIVHDIQSTIEGLKSAKDLQLISLIVQAVVFACPVLGLAIFGILAIVNVAVSFGTKGDVKYNVGGALIGMCSPYFLLLGTASLTKADNAGFMFPEYFKSTSLIFFLVGIIVYVGCGIVADFLGSNEEGGNFMGPIIKLGAAGLGLAAAFFMFGATNIYVTGGNAASYSSACMWVIFELIYALGGNDFQYVMPIFAFLFYMLAVVGIFSSIGSLFGKNKAKEKIQPISLYFVGIAVNIATVFISLRGSSGSSDMYGMVSICGFVAFGLLIAFAVAGIVSSKMEPKN